MPRTVILKEAQAPYILSLEEATLSQETVILEREGRPVAVVVPFGEYEAFAAWRQQQMEGESWRAQEYGLLTNDSLIVAVMQRYRLHHLATHDRDFARISSLRVWCPIPFSA